MGGNYGHSRVLTVSQKALQSLACGRISVAPLMGISWNHLVPVIHALDALIGAVTTFSHIVKGIP